MTEAQVAHAKVARAEKIKRALIVATTLLVLVCLALLVVLLGQVRNTQLEGTPTGKRLLTSSDRIIDCTEPSGECYQENQDRTAGALASVQRIVLLSAVCAVDINPDDAVAERIAAITKCVTTRLADQAP